MMNFQRKVSVICRIELKKRSILKEMHGCLLGEKLLDNGIACAFSWRGNKAKN
jgi:hypothetical protein